MTCLVPTLSSDASRLAALLRAEGVRVDELQVGRIVPLSVAIPSDAAWIAVTSQNSIPSLSGALRAHGPVRIAAVGKKTAAALESAGIPVSFVPSVPTSASLHSELSDLLPSGTRIFDFKGYENEPVEIEETVDLARYDAAVFTCASSVDRLFAHATGMTRCCAIGPSTSLALQRYGVPEILQAKEPTLESLRDLVLLCRFR